MLQGLRDRVERRRQRRRLPRVRVGKRRFQITRLHEYPSHATAYLSPQRGHRHSWTEVRFKVWEGPRGSRGLVTVIDVDEAHRRQGWASAMVEGLLELYPGRVWAVENPNEESGQLFVYLARKHPGVILPPAIDTSVGVDDPRRYSTPPGFR